MQHVESKPKDTVQMMLECILLTFINIIPYKILTYRTRLFFFIINNQCVYLRKITRQGLVEYKEPFISSSCT
jgi:hypothetical protein